MNFRNHQRTTLVLMIASVSLLTSATAAAELERISPETLEGEWNFYGKGTSAAQNRMFYMEEGDGSKGVMLVSPKSYDGDLTIRYEIMPMNAASVCVAILYASDTAAAESLSIPTDYDGSMGLWINDIDNYFFAFHNAAHDRTPFGIRFPSKESIGELKKNVMHSGEFHTIEITRRGSKLSLSINGESHFIGHDPEPLESGHIAFRIRGIPQIPAACLIRGLEIEKHHS